MDKIPFFQVTKEEFVESLKEIDVPWIKRIIHVFPTQPLPRLAADIARHCFIYDVPQTRHTELLKYQLRHLEEEGVFDFKPGEDDGKKKEGSGCSAGCI